MYRTYRGKPQNGNPVVAPQSGPLALQPLPELPLEDGVSVWTAQSLDALRRKVQMGDKEQELLQKNLFRTIDILGARSQRAQGVNEPLTTVSRLHESNTYRLYLLVHQYQGLGILKVGVKKLFISHPSTKQLVELDPLCVLDFYVDESVQRKGYGNQIYREMLENEKTRPELLAIDRPSPKFLGFMKKHYSLDSFTPQGNNFVVFHRFFDNTTVTERGQLRRIADSNAAAGPTATVAADPRHLKGSPGAGAREDETGLGRGLASAGSPPALGMLTPTLPIHPTGGASAPPVSHAPTSWHTDMVRPMPMPNCGPTYTQPQALLSPSPYNNYNSGARPLPVLRRGPPPLASTAPVYPPRAAPQAGYRQVPRARAPPQAYTVPSRPRFPTANAPSPPLIYRPGHILAAGGLPQLHSQPTRGYPKSMGGSTWPQHPLSGIQAVGGGSSLSSGPAEGWQGNAASANAPSTRVPPGHGSSATYNIITNV